jgi:hypothetical protein
MHSSHDVNTVIDTKIKDGNNSFALSYIPDVKLNIVNVLTTLFYDTLCELQRNLQYIQNRRFRNTTRRNHGLQAFSVTISREHFRYTARASYTYT